MRGTRGAPGLARGGRDPTLKMNHSRERDFYLFKGAGLGTSFSSNKNLKSVVFVRNSLRPPNLSNGGHFFRNLGQLGISMSWGMCQWPPPPSMGYRDPVVAEM